MLSRASIFSPVSESISWIASISSPKSETRQARVRKELKFSLIGVILQPDKQYALVRQSGKKEILRLARGQKIDGWQVDSILPDRLVLSYAGDVVELELKDARIKRPTVQRRKAKRDRARQAG